jgi:hypothetical protein
MKIGSLVICINELGWISLQTGESQRGPLFNRIYTVSGFPISGYITLEEFPDMCEDGTSQNWQIEQFVEIQPPMDIEIDELIKEPLEV